LKAWTDRYDAISTPFEATQIRIRSERFVQVNGRTALRREGLSPLTEFKYVNIPQGETVWFIWTNSDDAQAAIYDHIVASFRFGEKTPQTLQGTYGPGFHPLSIDDKTRVPAEQMSQQPSGITGRVPGMAKLLIMPSWLSSSWIEPVNGRWDVRCDSSWHTGGADHAIDIPLPIGTDVYAAQPDCALVVFWGYDSSGYGNLIKIAANAGMTYYAHLNVIDPNMWTNNCEVGTMKVGQNTRVGWSGNTGNSTGPHLHFHVQSGSSGVDLTGMTGFYPNAGYPCCANPCGYVSY